jgi:phospholipid/cholesterol/gamma-HCH transport system substrate-binding protein
MAIFSRGEKPRTLRKDRTGFNPITVAVISIVVILVAVFFGYTKDWPFSRGYQFSAVFTSSNAIRTASPVRIAGVNVGKVVKVSGQEGTDNAVVTMEVQESALPIHRDATLKIRPRIFLEGNFFVDLKPGTPSAPTIEDGDTIPVSQTAIPVQLNQVLTSLQQDSRTDLQVLLIELGGALSDEPTPAEDADQPPMNRGLTAAQALNESLIYGEEALKNSALVNQALQGADGDNLTGVVRGLAATTGKLTGSEPQLASLVENFNTTMGALAAEQSSLRSTIRYLGPTVRHAYSSLGATNAALPNVRAFALASVPGLEEIPATLEAVTPFLDQALPLLSTNELGGLAANLQPTTANLAALSGASLDLLPQTQNFAQCTTNYLVPVGDVPMPDGEFSTGKPNFHEFWYGLVGANGEGAGFDGNGQFVRLQAGGGAYPVRLTGGNLGGGEPIYGNSLGRPQGTRPAWDSKVPAYQTKALCKDQALPNFAATKTGPSD